jgi:hypothetical protein
MANFRKLAIAAILADGKIDETEVGVLRKELKEADGKIGEEGIQFLTELRDVGQKKAKAKKEEISPAFENFFFKVVQDKVLEDGKIDAAEAGFLRKMLFADGKIDDGEMKFLTSLNKKAKAKSPEFEKLYTECETKHKKATAKK